MMHSFDDVYTVSNLRIQVLQKVGLRRISDCCVYKTLVDGPYSRGRGISAIYCLSDSKKNLGAFGTTHGN
jgi:hypothetical protein